MARKIIDAILTPDSLRHESSRTQEQSAASSNHTMVYIPVCTNGLPLLHEPKN